MSLVNDMLRDLDAGQRGPLPAGVDVAEREEHPAGRRGLWSVLLLVSLISGAFYAGLHWRGAADLSRPTVDAAGPFPPAEMAVVPAAVTPVTAEATDPAPSPEPESVSKTEEASAAKIAVLLAAAEAALADDRLTSPLEDNAFSRYQAVLLLRPDQPEALAGIRKIAGRYLHFLASSLRDGDEVAARHYRDRGKRVVSAYPELERWFDERRIAIEKPFELLAETKPSSIPAEAESGAVALGNVSIQPSKTERQKQLVERAEGLLARGRIADAQAMLADYLRDNPGALIPRKALFELYLAADKLQAATEQFDLLNDLPEQERVLLGARLAQAKGRVSEAIAEMESIRPRLEDAPDYYAYLAALYHRAKRYRESGELYRQLLGRDGARATYWLGLAVSLDAQGDRKGALQAFRNVRRFGDPDAGTRAYVDQRIASLGD